MVVFSPLKLILSVLREICAQTLATTMWLRLVIKLKVIVIVSVETGSNPYGNFAEIKAFDLSMDPCKQSGPAKF